MVDSKWPRDCGSRSASRSCASSTASWRQGGGWRLRRHVEQLHRRGEGVCQRAQRHSRRRVEAVRADPACEGSSRRPDRTSRQGGHPWAGAASHAGPRHCVCGHGHGLSELLHRYGAPSGHAGRQRRQAVMGLHPIPGRMSWDAEVGRDDARPGVVSRMVDNSARLDYLSGPVKTMSCPVFWGDQARR